jgi:hypothetical protein
MKRFLVVAALGAATSPAFALGNGALASKLPAAPSAMSLPNFGQVTSALTVATIGFGKGGSAFNRATTLPALGVFDAKALNTGKGGDYIAQYSYQSPAALAAGDPLPAAVPAPRGGTSKLPPFSIDYLFSGPGVGPGQPLPLPPVFLPVGLGTSQLTLSNEGSGGRLTIATHYSTH